MKCLILFFLTFQYANADIPEYPPRPTGGNFTQVTEQLGPLVVKEGAEEAQSIIQPWSSWWFPTWQKSLFEGQDGIPSPLEQYDRAARNVGERSAVEYEKENIYSPRAATWEGLCDAWAVASIMEAEPTQPVTYNNVTFRVGDLKALILKIYEKVSGLDFYGQRNDAVWDSVYEDVYPEQFHKFLQTQLFQNKLPFIIDHDASFEVWNEPVWYANTEIVRDSKNDNLVHVTTYLKTASSHVDDWDMVGTMEVVRIYTYDLYGYWDSYNKFEVQYGIWTGNSVSDHPDYMIGFPNDIHHESRNPYIDWRFVRNIRRGN